MEIWSPADRPTRTANPDYFTGTVLMDPIVEAPDPARIRCLRVSFLPGARTAWHTHPYGQTLHVLSGCGRIQCWDEPVRVIKSGDTVWIPPAVKHWHGASPDCAMVHMAMQEAKDGVTADWLEKVSDEQYLAAPQ